MSKIPSDSLRNVVTECLNGLLVTIQNDFKDPKLQELVRNAYPTVDGISSANASKLVVVCSLYSNYILLLPTYFDYLIDNYRMDNMLISWS